MPNALERPGALHRTINRFPANFSGNIRFNQCQRVRGDRISQKLYSTVRKIVRNQDMISRDEQVCKVASYKTGTPGNEMNCHADFYFPRFVCSGTKHKDNTLPAAYDQETT